MTTGWSFWVDRGGTFTDIVAEKPSGELVVHKLLSENPGRYLDAAVHGIGEILAAHADAGAQIREVKLGTTVATNALLERKGDRTAFVVTAGFADLLQIGDQARPRLFDRHIVLPTQLYSHVIEADERICADGAVRRPLDLDKARVSLRAAFDEGYRSIAIALLHAYREPAHELALEALAREIGFEQISVSHRISTRVKIVPRAATAVLDAYLSPPLRRYVAGVESAIGAAVPLSFMQSNGGLAQAHAFQGRDAVLSGPAGGVVGMIEVARVAGFDKVIGFDMGGTSTDVSHYAGALERSYESTVAGVRLQTPMMSIHTVAAGGGSICRFDGARLRVGPESAGANPGPACYRRGGPLTITDCNVLLGKIQPQLFPAVFGPNGDSPIDVEAVRRQFDALADQVSAATGRRLEPRQLAEGLLAIAIDNMAHAIKRVSVARGYDLTEYALLSFGGAGGQHACAVAEALGIKSIIISPLAGVLSAYGIGRAEHRSVSLRSIEEPLGAVGATIAKHVADLETDLQAREQAEGARTFERRVHLKHQGTDTSIALDYDDPHTLGQRFAEAYKRRFSFSLETPIIVEAVEVELIVSAPKPASRSAAANANGRAQLGAAPIWTHGALVDAALFDRNSLAAGAIVKGPAIVFDATGTTVIEPNWSATVNGAGDLILSNDKVSPRAVSHDEKADPVKLEVFGNLFMAIAEEMGVALQSTAQSVNIKERLDFSCAVFDQSGALIANAPHMPVHLGSMGDSVRAVMDAARHRGDALMAGDVYAVNNPYDGGTHLPDITTVMPVFDEAGVRLLYFVAARGHHADIGGITPGSMPPNSTTIEQEGVLLDCVRIVHEGRFAEDQFVAAMSAGPYPARNVAQNLGDIRAQVAACARGAERLARAGRDHGVANVMRYMGFVQDAAAEAVRLLLDRLKDGAFRYEADDGWAVEVKLKVDHAARQAIIDVSNSDRQLPGNFNAPPSITRAAALYVVRTLVDDEIPMNDGCLRPITIVNPSGTLLNPRPPAAVVAGNVETSQIVTDALYAAAGALAAAQGTMNNFTFGDDRLQYYETICGGAGAGPGFDGADAVHTHMTNSRLTDPEVIELRFPVLLDAFAIRRGSGGAGKHHGGDGVIRKLRFLAPMHASILSNRRRVAPFGLAGGENGATGRNYVLRASGAREDLPACASIEVHKEDVFVIETPGGGGYGARD
jgi:5-oxoprolinase (ATP-hydrolysing)